MYIEYVPGTRVCVLCAADAPGHVNNVNYARWAEAARVNLVRSLGRHVDAANGARWNELMTPRSTGLILRSIRVDYKFVRAPRGVLRRRRRLTGV